MPKRILGKPAIRWAQTLSTFFFTFYCTAIASLANAGEWSIETTWDALQVAAGGLEQKSAGLASVTAAYGMNWGRRHHFQASLLGNYGGDPSGFVGDIQGVSNINAPDTATLFDLWYQHRFANEQVSALIGLQDYNAAFSVLSAGQDLLNASFGIGPDIAQSGTSLFPVTSLGALVQWLGDHHYVLTSVFDGVAGDPDNPRGTQVKLSGNDGLFSGIEWGLGQLEAGDKLALGLWHSSAPTADVLTGDAVDSTYGGYALAQKQGSGWQLFMQLGIADTSVNTISRYLGAGLRFETLWQTGDALSLGIAHARVNPLLRERDGQTAAETAIEVTYALDALKTLRIQPDVQYIINPGFDQALKNAWVLGVRVQWVIGSE